MKFAEKEFLEYWKVIKIPTYALIGWSVLGFIISVVSFSLYLTVFSPLASWILIMAVFAFIGWTVIKDRKATVKIAAWSGALSGAISGFVGGLIGILMYYFVPDVIEAALAQAAHAGANAAAIESFMAIGVYIGF